MTKEQKRNTVIIVISLIIGYIIGCLTFGYKTDKDIKIFVNGEQQVLRNEEGKKVYPIIKGKELYIPYSELGSFMGYMTIENSDKNEIYLYSVEDTGVQKVKGFSTESLEGVKVTDSVFSEADYTVMMVWSTWCPDCEKELKDFKEHEKEFEKYNVQFISIPTDIPLLSEKEDFLKSDYVTVTEKSCGFNFKYHLFRDNVLNTNIVGNTSFIPKLVIFDNLGNLVKIIDKQIMSEELISILDKIS
jgi:thiol-disulfide isomerase/thioredoxin